SISGAGHFSHEEKPDEVNGHLSRFLERVYRSPLN
ncbi:MAG TPA: alpha/beta hydrolase, partial [Mycobacterium sp.]